jgi:hypothetical protein
VPIPRSLWWYDIHPMQEGCRYRINVCTVGSVESVPHLFGVVDPTIPTIDNAYRTDSIWIDKSVIGIDHWRLIVGK